MFRVNLLGSDPEFILRDKQTLLPVSAIGLYEHQDSVKLYSDNVLAEASHSPFTPSEFSDGISSVVSSISSIVSGFKDGCTFTIGECEAVYPEDQLCTPEAHAIGCNPFFNAYELGVHRTPMPYVDNTRYAGGHLHIAYDHQTLPPHLLVQLLDDHLLPLDPNHGKTNRSAFYGARGSFRTKPYGVEYRSLSNWWLSNPSTVTDALSDIQNYVNRKYYGV